LPAKPDLKIGEQDRRARQPPLDDSSERQLDGLSLRLAQADTGSSAILCRKFDAYFFESFTQFRNCLLLRRQRARLNFKSLYAGQ
jgi:hypothetical protein